jgi:hypothetical protein
LQSDSAHLYTTLSRDTRLANMRLKWGNNARSMAAG